MLYKSNHFLRGLIEGTVKEGLRKIKKAKESTFLAFFMTMLKT